MSISKEIKGHLKAAKVAIDKQEFETARNHCQAIFQKDEGNYMSLVFAGLACLKLGEYADSRQYYKAATTTQPDGPLAWKGFADYFDKHRPVVKDDQLEAIDVYTKLLPLMESDVSKTRSTYHKLINLHKEFNHQLEIIKCYEGLISSFKPSHLSDEADTSSLSEVWFQYAFYLLNRDEITEECWEKLQNGFPVISESESKQELRVKLVKRSHSRYMASSLPDSALKMFIEEECRCLLDHNPLISLPVLVRLVLMQKLPLHLEDLTEQPILLSEEQRDWVQRLHDCVQQTGSDADTTGSPGCTDHTRSLGWGGRALMCVGDKKWTEARDAIKTSVSFSSVPCECWVISSLMNLYFCDYRQAERAAEKGIASLAKLAAKFMSLKLERSLKLLLCRVHMGQDNIQQLTQDIPYLRMLQESCASHVTRLLVRIHIILGDILSAQLIVDNFHEVDENMPGLLVGLQGEISLAQKDYETALSKFDEALKHHPSSLPFLFARARVLWEDQKQERQKAYSAFLQAAKADPMNAEVFVYLGHYQREINGDLKRAEKCYQKAVALQPSNPEASLCLGDVLWSNGEEERAYEIYTSITSEVLPSRAKMAWMRMGLYQKKKKLFNESINSFQTILASFPDDRLFWECLGESYLARGSYDSALRTFTRCVQLNPDSLHCHYRIGTIKFLLGLLKESLIDYSHVLDMDPDYVPALKGIGEVYMQLAQLALQQNFDGCAVDNISSAMKYFTLAARLRPQFICLWKLLGDSCTCLHQIASSVARPRVPNVLRSCYSESDELKYQIVEKRELLEIGCRCYGRATQLDQEGAYLWNDLSLGYFYLSKCLDAGSEERQQMISTSLKAAQKAVGLDHTGHLLWNTLGVIAACDEVNDPALAQHCFIRSIQEEKNNSLAWTNLGALYLKHDSTELSYEAFKKAQALSPDCAQAWIGHAFIAERIGSSESMDLFRHSLELEYHSEASIAYGYWVCQTLVSLPPKLTRNPGGLSLNEPAYRAVLLARDNLQKLVVRDLADACGLNYLGLLYEQEGLLREASKAFKRALECCHGQTDSNVLAIRFNLARVQSKLGSGADSIPSLMAACKSSVATSNSSDVWLELALALFRESRLEESQQAYEQCITISKRNSNKEEIESTVLTAQAMVAFTRGDNDACKKYLFQAFQTTPVSLHGLVALTMLACLTNDPTLLLATLKELGKVMELQPDEIVLLHPSCARALQVAKFLLICNELPQDTIEAISGIIDKLPEHQEPIVPPPLPMTLQTLLTNSSNKTSKEIASCAQKLVHSYPTNVWALATLTAQIPQIELIDGYKHLMEKVECELSVLSAKQVHSPWLKAEEEGFTELINWIKSV